MKFSEMTSNQSTRAVPSQRRGKCVGRRPTPWPRYGTAIAMPKTGGRLLLDDLAAPLVALLGGLRLDEAHALAGVLALAIVLGALAASLALALVEPRALDGLHLGLVLGRRRQGAGERHRGHGRRDHDAFADWVHGVILPRSCVPRARRAAGVAGDSRIARGAGRACQQRVNSWGGGSGARD